MVFQPLKVGGTPHIFYPDVIAAVVDPEITVKACVHKMGVGRCGTGVYLSIPECEASYLVTSQVVEPAVAGVDIVNGVFCEKIPFTVGLMKNLIGDALFVTTFLDGIVVDLDRINGH